MNKLKPKESHIIISIVFGSCILVAFLILGFNNILIINSSQLVSALLTTDGIFIGFVISALGIYYSIPLREEIKSALIKQGYLKQVSRNFITCIVGFSLSLLLSIINMCFNLAGICGHIFNTLNISVFISSLLLLILNSINFFKIVTKN